MTPMRKITRRWYHRYAVLEQSLLTGVRRVSSWHVTEAGAVTTTAALIAHYWCEERGRYVSDVFDFMPLPAGHHLVRQVEHQQVSP